MNLRFVPRSLRDALIRRLRFFSHDCQTLKFEPYDGLAEAFVIPKAALPPAGSSGADFLVPPRELWVGYGSTPDEWVQSGVDHSLAMLSQLKRSGFTPARGMRILDFGCGAGRMLRQLAPYAEDGRVWGVDVSSRHIQWCKQHLTPPFRFAVTTTIPHLPFRDNSLDLVYCGSVFTHIDDLADAWVLELRRVLSDHGRVFLTIHDQHTLELLSDRESNSWLASCLKKQALPHAWRQSFAMLSVGRDIVSQVFYDLDYFKQMVSSVFQVESMVQEAYGYQTGLVLSPRR